MGYTTVISMHSTTNLFHCQTGERERDDQYSGSQLILPAEKDIYTVHRSLSSLHQLVVS